MIKKIKKGELYLIEYQDATYSYNSNLLKGKNIIPPKVLSFGILRDINNNFIDLALIWEQDKKGLVKKYIQGLIIPYKTITKIKLIKL